MKAVGLGLSNLLRIRRSLRLVWQSSPGWCVASAVLLIMQGLLPLAALYLMKLIVEAVSHVLTDPSASFAAVGLLIGLAGAVALVEALCMFAASLVGEAQSQLVTDRVMDLLHAKSLEADLEYYETPQYHDRLHMAQQEAPYRPLAIVNSLVGFCRSGLSLIAVTALLFSFHWIIALVLFAAILPGIVVRFRYAGKMYRWQRARTPTERLCEYLNWMLTGDEHAKEIRLFNLGDRFRKRYRGLRRQLRRERIGLTARRSLYELAARFGATAAVFGALAFIAHRAVHGAISVGALVMYYLAFQRGQAFLRDMLSNTASIYENNLFVANFFEFLDLAPKVATPAAPIPLPSPLRQGIVLKGVSFAYPTGTRQVLDDVSLNVQPGEHIALVGENGAGKTTLVKLLCRLYDPTGGSISVDGVDLRTMSGADVRRHISVIFQDYVQYHLTARQNIWVGDAQLDEQDPRIEEAARLAGADGLIRGLPQGYETVLSKWFDDGEQISIGEWQKIALARAFVRDAPILVLDEPTSALDAKAEYEVFQQFHELAHGRMAFIISHRMSTVRMAHRIIVLHDGRIAESGTHDELVARGGIYAGLFEMQAERYR